MTWITAVPADALYLSIITIGEIAKGIAKQRRARASSSSALADPLQTWLEGLLAPYAE